LGLAEFVGASERVFGEKGEHGGKVGRVGQGKNGRKWEVLRDGRD
jgi:hypothetical protein